MWTLPPADHPGLALYVIERMRRWDRREIFALHTHEDDLGLLAAALSSDQAWLAGRDETPIALYGCRQRWPGVWSMWLFATDNFPQIGKSVTRHVTADIVPALFRGGAHRLECRSMEGHTDAQAWLELIGAEREGTEIALGRGREDFHVYVWRQG